MFPVAELLYMIGGILFMAVIKREAVLASIRSQLMQNPQRGTILLLNVLKLFADRKDDGEFVKEIADLAGDLAAVSMEAVFAQSPLFAQPMPMPYLQGASLPSGSIPVPSFADFTPNEPIQQPVKKQTEEKHKEIADDAVTALNQMGEDTTQFLNRNSNEPTIEGYEEWTPKPKKNNRRTNTNK